MRPLVKICGLTRPEDARLAVALGASHIGVVMAEGSPRRVTAIQARGIFEAAGDRVRHVLVFKNEKPSSILLRARAAGTTHVQLYGASEQDVELLEEAGLTVYRVHLVKPGASELPRLLPVPDERHPALIDTGGGTGAAFAWEILAPQSPPATFIAGGIRPDNVRSLLAYRPYGIDLSSGVERAPAIKDPERLRLLFGNLEGA